MGFLSASAAKRRALKLWSMFIFVCSLSVAFREGVCTTFADSSTCSQDDPVRFDVRAARRPKLAVLLTGFANRSIQFTANSVRRRVLIPCRSYGYDVDVFVYSFYSEKGLDVDETRGGELASPTNSFAEVEDILNPKVVVAHNQETITSLSSFNHTKGRL